MKSRDIVPKMIQGLGRVGDGRGVIVGLGRFVMVEWGGSWQGGLFWGGSWWCGFGGL